MKVYVYKGEILYQDEGWEIIVYPSKANNDGVLGNDRECLLDALFVEGHDVERMQHFSTMQLEQLCLSRGMYVQLID